MLVGAERWVETVQLHVWSWGGEGGGERVNSVHALRMCIIRSDHACCNGVSCFKRAGSTFICVHVLQIHIIYS